MEEAKELVLVPDTGIAVSIHHSQIAVMNEQIKLLGSFISGQLKEGQDYGRFGGATKDTLLKPGAEKLKRLFSIGDRIVKHETVVEEDFVKHTYTVEIYSLRTGVALTQCEGSANSVEKRNWDEAPLKHDNTIAKIAHKRALVGAVISATGASDFFTQDMEDTVEEQPSYPRVVEPAEYLCPIGNKYRGKKLRDIPRDDLRNFVTWLHDENQKKGERFSPKTQEFVDMAQAYLG